MASISAGRFFDSYALVKLSCENLSQHPQNTQVHLHIKPGPLYPLAKIKQQMAQAWSSKGAQQTLRRWRHCL